MGIFSFLGAFCQLVVATVGLIATYRTKEDDSIDEDSIWNLYAEDGETTSRPMLWLNIILSVALMVCAGLLIKGSVQVGVASY